MLLAGDSPLCTNTKYSVTMGVHCKLMRGPAGRCYDCRMWTCSSPMAGGSEGEAFFVVLERERDGCFLPHKKRVQGRTEAAMERERKGGCPGPGGVGGKASQAHELTQPFFFHPKQTNKPKRIQTTRLLQKTKEENQMQSSPTIYTPLHDHGHIFF